MGRAGCVLATACVLAAAGIADAAPGSEADAVRAFLRAYDTRDARVRKKAVGLLRDVPGGAATAALLPALGDEAASVRQAAREVLAGRVADADLAALADRGLRDRLPEVRLRSALLLAAARTAAAPHGERLAAALRDREAPVREAVAAAIGATGHRGQATAVAAALRSESSPEVRGALLLALAATDPGAGTEAARRAATSDRAGPPCTAALAILDAANDAGAAEAAHRLLSHAAWEVRCAAAALLARRPGASGAALPAMVASLAKEERRRVRAALADALERLTGLPFGEDAERWTQWWRKEGATWSPDRVPPAPPPTPHRTEGSVARFYDVPLDGDRVVFAIDTSKSMEDPARLGEEASKMQLATAAFARTAASLRDDCSLNVVTFGTDVSAWRPRVVPAGPAARTEALRFLQKQPPAGRTNIFDALAAAMTDPEVDTVLLLTDGAPSEGEETTRTGFLAGLARLRRWRPVRVHCVEIGAANTGSRWKGFLAEVAAATGGVHVAR